MRHGKNNQTRTAANLNGGRLLPKIMNGHGTFWRLPTIKEIAKPILPSFRFN